MIFSNALFFFCAEGGLRKGVVTYEAIGREGIPERKRGVARTLLTRDFLYCIPDSWFRMGFRNAEKLSRRVPRRLKVFSTYAAAFLICNRVLDNDIHGNLLSGCI